MLIGDFLMASLLDIILKLKICSQAPKYTYVLATTLKI